MNMFIKIQDSFNTLITDPTKGKLLSKDLLPTVAGPVALCTIKILAVGISCLESEN